MKHQGGCHCGAVTFEIETPEEVVITHCNCSICKKTGYLHLIVSSSDFKLLSGEESITTYQFNTGVAKHTFCKNCGIKSFYVPRSHPNGISVNVRCLNTVPKSTTTEYFDGENWELSINRLHKLDGER